MSSTGETVKSVSVRVHGRSASGTIRNVSSAERSVKSMIVRGRRRSTSGRTRYVSSARGIVKSMNAVLSPSLKRRGVGCEHV